MSRTEIAKGVREIAEAAKSAERMVPDVIGTAITPYQMHERIAVSAYLAFIESQIKELRLAGAIS